MPRMRKVLEMTELEYHICTAKLKALGVFVSQSTVDKARVSEEYLLYLRRFCATDGSYAKKMLLAEKLLEYMKANNLPKTAKSVAIGMMALEHFIKDNNKEMPTSDELELMAKMVDSMIDVMSNYNKSMQGQPKRFKIE